MFLKWSVYLCPKSSMSSSKCNLSFWMVSAIHWMATIKNTQREGESSEKERAKMNLDWIERSFSKSHLPFICLLCWYIRGEMTVGVCELEWTKKTSHSHISIHTVWNKRFMLWFQLAHTISSQDFNYIHILSNSSFALHLIKF